ncbi:sugar ABC transporter substrate-binding protein [Niallia taxi]|uniref:sugar ABC transporter substrate-binding protein n=1 Tax=Niallia taxi TaxID=2499688 RepID=UPI00254FDAB0|nr:substrate-binding domain-containing protein [Niallia taxi]MDK8640870.1 substrate-binding domain-containing protein [Niallia taxi]MED4052796.1 substrate-binding domain-containing protein [Niallia taxi]MED4120151.1 substrate-binding domain-containing protein [Niallia taxi]
MRKSLQRKLMAGACVMAMTFLAACSQTTTENSQPKMKLAQDDSKVYVGFSLDTLQEDRWYKDKEAFEKKVLELGGEVKTLAANGVDSVQIKQAELLIAEGVDVLVVVPHNAEVSAEIVDKAHKANVKVVSYDRLIKNADVDYYISYDNKKVGQLQAQEILKKQKKGNFAYIGGAETDNNAVLFREGAMEVLQPYIDKGDIKLVYDKYTDEWQPEIAETNMKQALKENNNNIQAVIAANDGTAGGVIHALQAIGKTIPVSGQDAEITGLKRILAGSQTMTVYKPIQVIAEDAAAIAMKAGKNEKIDTTATVNNGKIDVPSILLDPVAVTKSNIDETVIKDKFITEDELK